MNWLIRGIDRGTGEPRSVHVSADTETDAIRLASREGVVTERVQAVLSDAPHIIGGWSIFREGKTRTRYLVSLIWSSRVGGFGLAVIGLWWFKKMMFPDPAAYTDEEFRWFYWMIGFAMVGGGAAVVLVGEIAGEIVHRSASISGGSSDSR